MDFLVKYDELKSAIQQIVDLPDRLLDLFIQLLYQNKGALAKGEKLTDEEIGKIEKLSRKFSI